MSYITLLGFQKGIEPCKDQEKERKERKIKIKKKNYKKPTGEYKKYNHYKIIMIVSN